MIPVKLLRNGYYFTDILDHYSEGKMEEVYSNDFFGEIRTKVFKIYYDSNTYLFKTIVCPKSLNKMLNQVRDKYELMLKLSCENSNIAEALDKKEWEDPNSGNMHIETLFKYEGKPLKEHFKKTPVKELMPILRKTLAPLALLEANEEFYFGIKPDNILINNGEVKLIDFGMKKKLKKKLMLSNTLSGKVKYTSNIYLPPEIIRKTEHYVMEKIDVYCWGMIIYQLATGKKTEELAEEAQSFKGPGKNYNEFIKKLKDIKLDEDTEGHRTKLFIHVLKKVLSLVPEERPSFTTLKDIFGEETHAMKVELTKYKEKIDSLELKVLSDGEEKKSLQGKLEKEKKALDEAKSELIKVKAELEQCKKKLKEEKDQKETPLLTSSNMGSGLFGNSTLKCPKCGSNDCKSRYGCNGFNHFSDCDCGFGRHFVGYTCLKCAHKW